MKSLDQQLVAALTELRQFYPDWRFGQLVANVASWAGREEPGNVWDTSDEALLRAAQEHLAKCRGASAGRNARAI